MRRLTPIASTVVSMLLLAACNSSSPVPNVDVTATSSATSSSSTTLPEFEPQAIDWNDPTVVADFNGGWSVHACEGDAPMLCVERNGEPVGTVEATSYALTSFEDMDPSDDAATNLQKLTEHFVAALGTDRAAGCGADYRFDPLAPGSFPIGGTGVFYGFEGRSADGSPSELNLQYGTVVDDRIITIVAAAYDEGGCPGRDDTSGFDSETLAEFRPWLELVLADSPLPDLPPAP